MTFEQRFKNRLERVSNTLRPSSSAGETVIETGSILSFKNASSDWRVSPDGVVEIKLYSLTAVNFGQPSPGESAWTPCRAFRSAGALVAALTDAALKDRSVEMTDGRRVPFLIEGSLELRPQVKEWLSSNARRLVSLISIPSKAGFDPDKEPDKAFEFRQQQLELLVNSTRTATDKNGILKHRIAVELLLGLEAKRTEQQE